MLGLNESCNWKICVGQSKLDRRVRICCKCMGQYRENVDYRRGRRNQAKWKAVKPVQIVSMLHALCTAQE